MVATLRLLQTEASAHHAVVSGVTPVETNAPSDSGRQEVTISLRGRYRDVLGIVADLSRHDPLIEVTDVELDASSDRALPVQVDATVHAIVYHGLKGVMKEKNHGLT